MIDWAGYELDRRSSSIDAQFGPGAAVRAGRPAGRGVQGPGAGPAAADHHAGAPDAGAHQHLRGAQGRPRPGRGGHRGAGAAAGALLRAGRGAPGDRRRSTSTRCWPPSDRLLALDARVILHPADLPARRPAPARDPALPAPVPRDLDGPRPASCSASGPSGRRTRRCWSSSTGRCRSSRSTSATSRTWASTGASPTSGSIRVCFTDYDRELALVAERRDPETGAPVSPRSAGCPSCATA